MFRLEKVGFFFYVGIHNKSAPDEEDEGREDDEGSLL